MAGTVAHGREPLPSERDRRPPRRPCPWLPVWGLAQGHQILQGFESTRNQVPEERGGEDTFMTTRPMGSRLLTFVEKGHPSSGSRRENMPAVFQQRKSLPCSEPSSSS